MNDVYVLTNDDRIDLVLSPCSFFAYGLVNLMLTDSATLVKVDSDFFNLSQWKNIRRLVVYLPDEPYILLNSLLLVSRFLNQSKIPLSTLLLSRLSANLIWNTLLYQVVNKNCVLNVQLVTSDLSIQNIKDLLCNNTLDNYPSLNELSEEEDLINGGGVTA